MSRGRGQNDAQEIIFMRPQLLFQFWGFFWVLVVGFWGFFNIPEITGI